ncbi:helix-turn-helix domain-containing protein [Streptomyces sp. SID685]|uniref:Crp/Fnr family transcriptional regulator n=1 Tax=Streptomyces TaxID=1883 RepID=UPI00136D147D|nr:Crp/Fnr family transcriptional regulator [Streptomyces sp. SID685]MYR90886.1 helix-turn-helix domain-containing protein [Streptomyces sp. SID685]
MGVANRRQQEALAQARQSVQEARRQRVMGSWQPMVLGNSVYAFDEETGLVGHGLSGSRAVRALIDLHPFLAALSPNLRHDLTALMSTRSNLRGTQLRGSVSSMIHIVLSGCVYEESNHGEDTTARIHGAGSILGAAEVFDPDLLSPTARCLNNTLTMAISLARLRSMAEGLPLVGVALGKVLAERLVIGERVYSRHGLSPEQRLAGLFVHLLDRCAVPCLSYGRMLEGPSQTDLAAVLSVSRATVENALKALRDLELVTTGYRQYRFPDERELAAFGRVRTPAQTVTGSAGVR